MVQEEKRELLEKPKKRLGRPPGTGSTRRKVSKMFWCYPEYADSLAAVSTAEGRSGSDLLAMAWDAYCEAHFPSLTPARMAEGEGKTESLPHDPSGGIVSE